MEMVLLSITSSMPTQKSEYLSQFIVAMVTPLTPRLAKAVYLVIPQCYLYKDFKGFGTFFTLCDCDKKEEMILI